jgi:hypothetical protein
MATNATRRHRSGDRARSEPAAPSPRAEIDAFIQRARTLRAGRGRQARPADLRARRHHEPPADLGYRLPAAGRDVPRGGAIGGLDVQLVYFRG